MSVLKLPVPVKLGGTGADNPTQAKINLEINFDDEIPIGALNYFPNANGDSYLTSGLWLKCNGQVVSQATYSTLFDRIGLINNGGAVWTTHATAMVQAMQNGAANGALSVIVGGSGQAQTSTDGITWTATSSTGTVSNAAGLVYASGKFVLSAGTYIAYSTNGSTWKTRTPNAVSLIFNAGLGVCCGNNGGIFYTSTDGITFDPRTSNFTQGSTGLAFGSGVYVACGASGLALTSTDGVVWATHTTPSLANFLCTCFGSAGNLFLIGAAGGILISSTDGITWSSRTSGTASQISSLMFGNSLYTMAGSGGMIRNSTDGITWTAATSNTASNLNGIIFANSLYVAVGSGGSIVTSADGSTYTARTSGTASIFNCVTYGGLYVAGGSAGILFSSTDAITWTARTSGTTSTILTLAYDGSKYYAAGLNFALSSTDAITWTPPAHPTTNTISSLTFGNSLFVGAGTNGQIITSTDALTWTARTSGTATSFADVCFGGGLYVACGTGGLLYSSTDAITWTARTSGVVSILSTVIFAATKYFCAGSGGAFITSTDAITWTAITSVTTTLPFSGLTYANNILVGVGGSGLIVASYDETNFTLQNYPTVTTGAQLNALFSNTSYFIAGGSASQGVFTSPISYAYNSSTSFQLPTDAGLGIVVEVQNNFKRSLYVKALLS